jgi:hypothetical protein
MNNNSIKGIINLTENYPIDGAVEIQKNINDGLNHIQLDLSLPSDSINKLLLEIKDYDNFVEYNYSKNKHNIDLKYMGNNNIIIFRGGSKDVFVDIYSNTEYNLNRIYKEYVKLSNVGVSEIECFFDSYYIKGNQLDVSTQVKKFKDYETLDETYYPYINLDIFFEQFALGNENILILTGEPGLGKSKFASTILKYAFMNPDKLPYDKMEISDNLDNQYINVAYVKSTEILSMDAFWRKMENLTPDFVLIDDLDYMLTKRDAEVMTHEDTVKNNFLNQFLSFTDGITKNKTKFIITTNQEYANLDSAILRKGRIFDIIELRKLHNYEAKNIWLKNNLDTETFISIFGHTDVLPANLGSEIAKRTNKKIEQDKFYLKESGISMLHKNKRKLGL